LRITRSLRFDVRAQPADHAYVYMIVYNIYDNESAYDVPDGNA
jgi:hypothetical protein